MARLPATVDAQANLVRRLSRIIQDHPGASGSVLLVNRYQIDHEKGGSAGAGVKATVPVEGIPVDVRADGSFSFKLDRDIEGLSVVRVELPEVKA